MRRILHLWLQHWPIDRWRRAVRQRPNHFAAPAERVPFATVADVAGRRLLAAIDPKAAAAGLAPGMPLADALAFLPGLAVVPAQPVEDARALRRLAEWCSRYSPWTAPDGTDGVKIEITGCAHLWGGEEGLAADLAARLGRQGIAHRIAVADTSGAAWALARFAAISAPVILSSAELRAGLAPLPVEALRLDPLAALGLRRVGLRLVGDLLAMPREALVRRFDEVVVRRLDQALGDLPEPLSPLDVPPVRRVRLGFAEPIAAPADLAHAVRRLTADLVPRLALQGTGARRLDLAFHRLDGRVERIVLATSRPSRDSHHIAALFVERLDVIDPGPGVEDMILSAFAVEKLPPVQNGFAGVVEDKAIDGLAPLLDRLGNRLGFAALSRFEVHESHIPECASVLVPVAATASCGVRGASRSSLGAPHHEEVCDGVNGRPHPEPAAPGSARSARPEGKTPRPFQKTQQSNPLRPIRLFAPPEPVEAFWLLPDDPPFRFTWRRRAHRVSRADGPERIAGEWWRTDPGEKQNSVRDYYRVEDEDGQRFWLFRTGLPGAGTTHWYIHGAFA